MRIIISIVLSLGLIACSDDVKEPEAVGMNQAAVENVKVKAAPVAVSETPENNVVEEKLIGSTENVVSTQAVKKPDLQAVAMQDQVAEKTEAVVASLTEEKEVVVSNKQQAVAETPAVKDAAKTLKESKSAGAPIVDKAKVSTPVVEEVAIDSKEEAIKKEVVAMGDAAKGKILAKRCSACHDFGMKDKAGPHLQGVFNRTAGQSGFKKHSKTFKAANWVWNEERLLEWVCDSKAAVKSFTSDPAAKTKMPNQKMCGEKGKDIVAYLKTL